MQIGMRKKQGKLLNRLFAWILSAAFIFILISIFATYLQIKSAEEKQEVQFQHEVALRAVQVLKDYIILRMSEMKTLSAAPGMTHMEYERQKSLVGSLLNLDSSFIELSVLDSNGKEIIRAGQTGFSSKEDLRDISGEPLFIETKKGNSYAGKINFSPTGEPYQEMAVPINGSGEIVGVLAGTFMLFPVSKELTTFKAGNTGISYIVGGDGRLLAHYDMQLLSLGSPLIERDVVKRTVEGKEVKAFEKDSLYRNEKGKDVVASSLVVKSMGPELVLGGGEYGVIVEREVSEALSSVWMLIGLMVIISSGSILFTALAIMIGSRWILNPLRKLHEGAMALGAGDMDYRVNIKNGDELEALGESFNNMAERLQNAMKEISDKESQLQAIIDNMAEGLVLVNKDSVNIYVNPAFARLTGYSQQDFIGKRAGTVTTDTEEQEKLSERFSLRKKRIAAKIEINLLSKGGEKIPVIVSSAPILDSEGNFQGSVAIFTDISEIKKLQQERETLLRLAGIGEIAAVVSHEFRNSLGAITNAVYVLRSRLKDPDEKVERNLNLISQSIVSSNRIICNLLDFSRPVEPSYEFVSINDLVDEALSLTSFPDIIRIFVELDPYIPFVQADPEMLRRVFINLFLNAIDAMPQGGNLRVVTKISDSYAEVRVEDTGVGIKPEVVSKLFDAFFTTKMKGTGLGLYLSNQIVEKHGGVIKVESEEGKGAAFIVRLPLGND